MSYAGEKKLKQKYFGRTNMKTEKLKNCMKKNKRSDDYAEIKLFLNVLVFLQGITLYFEIVSGT